MTTTLRSVSALFALASLTAFGFGCSVETSEEIGTAESAIARADATPVIEPGCPEGTHEVCEEAPSGRLPKKSPKKNVTSVIAPPEEPPACTCVPDEEPPPPSACPEGQHEETVCEYVGSSGHLDKKSPKKNAIGNVIAPPSCETICVDDEPSCPDGNAIQTVCAPSASGNRRGDNVISPPECWEECVPAL